MTEAPRKETAEEQLLRLIEGAQGPKPPSVASAAAVRLSWRDRWLQAWGQVWGAAVLRWHLVFRSQSRGDAVLRQLQLANRLMWLVMAGVGIYCVAEVMLAQSRPLYGPITSAAGAIPRGAVRAPPSPDTLVRPLADYLSTILRRNPFTGTSGSTAAAPVQRAREHLKELVGSLVVVGIDRGPTPEALIEDKTQQRTYFVKVGDEVNGAVVKEISSRGVVVGYEGEEELLQ